MEHNYVNYTAPGSTNGGGSILSMKNDNVLWCAKRIQGELLKLDISLSTKLSTRFFKASGGEGRSVDP